MGVCFVKFQVNVVMLWVKKRNSAHVSTGSVFDGPIRRIHGLGYGVLKVWDGYGPENVNDTTKVSVMGEFLRGESQVPLGKVKEIGSKTIKDDIKIFFNVLMICDDYGNRIASMDDDDDVNNKLSVGAKVLGTDIAKISRKRSKPDKHEHGNGIECARAGRMLSKVNKS
ncbi:hypothetical protein Tco_1474632 [Tanacetum coccineum]